MSVSLSASGYLSLASIPPGSNLTFATWFLTGATNMGMFGFGRSDAAGEFYSMIVTGSQHVELMNRTGATTNQIDASGAYSFSTWQHAAFVLSGGTGAVYMNGGNKGTGVVSGFGTGGALFTVLGGNPESGVSGRFNGWLAHSAIWLAALLDDEVAALGKGFSPRMIRPSSLWAYWPNGGVDVSGTTWFDRWNGGRHMTQTGSGVVQTDPPIIYPTGGLYL